MDYKSLRYMLALEEEKLLAQAARRLGISQSSLSLYLLRLEENYGTPLYDRSRHCMTKAGAFYCEGARKILQLHTQALDDMKALSEHPSFSFGLEMGINEMLPSLVSSLLEWSAQAYPQVSLLISVFSEQTLLEMFHQEKLDLIYSYFPRNGIGHLNRKECMEESFLMAAPHNLPLSAQDPYAAFSSLPYIAMWKNSNIRSCCDAILYQHSLSPLIQVESSSYGFSNSMMSSGNYITVIPAGAAWQFSRFALYPLEPHLRVASGFYLSSNRLETSYSSHFQHTIWKFLQDAYCHTSYLSFSTEAPYEPEQT